MEKPSEELIEKLARMKELRIKSDENVEFNVEVFEQKQKEYQVELTMRRRQLKQTREELDAARVKNQELQYSIDAAKRSAQEYERNMNVAMENNKVLERTLHETIDAKSKAIRQYGILKSENRKLKDAITECETEKYNLLRMSDELKSRNVCNELYRTEIGNQQSKIAELINKTKESFKCLESQHKDLLVQLKDIESYKSVLSSVKIMEDKISRIVEENALLERELVQSKAKQTQLEQSMTSSDLDLRTKEEQFFFKEWKKCLCNFQQYVKTHDEITYNLMEQLKTEKEANTKLILMMDTMKSEDEFLKSLANQEKFRKENNE